MKAKKFSDSREGIVRGVLQDMEDVMELKCCKGQTAILEATVETRTFFRTLRKFTLGRYVKDMDIQERKTRTGSYTRYVIKLTERQYKFLLGELEVVHAYEAIDFMQKFFVEDVVTEAVVRKTAQKMTSITA